MKHRKKQLHINDYQGLIQNAQSMTTILYSLLNMRHFSLQINLRIYFKNLVNQNFILVKKRLSSHSSLD